MHFPLHLSFPGFPNNLKSPAISSSSPGPGGQPPHNLGAQKKTCPYCFQQLSWHALSRHIRDMHKAKTGFVTCKFCLKMFRNKNSLGCHMWRFHKDKDGGSGRGEGGGGPGAGGGANPQMEGAGNPGVALINSTKEEANA